MSIKYVMLAAALVVAPHAQADTQVTATVSDRYTTITSNEPYTTQECVTVDVPVYTTVNTPNKAAEKALLGMIIGGVFGKQISGNSDGAAAGAVVGGLIGADKGSKSTKRVITGYKKEVQCTKVTRYRTTQTTVYDYTLIEFELEGKTYRVKVRK